MSASPPRLALHPRPARGTAAVRRIAAIDVGSNSVRLVEVAKDSGAAAAYLVDDASEIDERWLDGASTVGVTSGASVPEELVSGVLDWLAEQGFDNVEEVEAVKERMVFALPREIRPARTRDHADT